jgi:hypothetical protein
LHGAAARIDAAMVFPHRRSHFDFAILASWPVLADRTIFNLTSGAPMNIVGGNTLYGLGTQFNGTPDVVGDFPRKTGVVWPLKPGDAFGNLFGRQFKQVKDPACASVAPGLVQWCTLNALADVNGSIVLRNAAPGQLGTLGLRPIEGFGSRSFDANVQKTIRIRESKTVTFRLDANNVLNHPNPGVLSPLINPVNLNINSGTFGEINSKNGSRTLQALLRFDF